MESEGEVEYLEEDAEIVQQCFQTPQTRELKPYGSSPVTDNDKTDLLSLLVERERPPKKKRKKEDDDSDYHPEEDVAPLSPPSTKSKKKKIVPQKKRAKVETTPNNSTTNTKANTISKRINELLKENRLVSAQEKFAVRKKLNIRIPDYDDPLCLPVKAVKQDNSDLKRLGVWNNVCIEHFKHCDTMLRPERGRTHSSSRSVVLRNVPNKQTGKIETTIWSKTCVQNEDGDKKSEIFQCVLPRYKEKRTVKTYSLSAKKSKPVQTVDVVLLTKEKHEDSEALVVYKPKESISSVYMLFDKSKSSAQDEGKSEKDDEDSKMYIKEMTCCKMCADCYQKSWRGPRTSNKKPLLCPICARTCVTVHNLLSHVKNHSSSEVNRYKPVINAVLAEFVDYHYRCRICQEKFNCIRNLKIHLKTHKAESQFLCEVGNHITQ